MRCSSRKFLIKIEAIFFPFYQYNNNDFSAGGGITGEA